MTYIGRSTKLYRSVLKASFLTIIEVNEYSSPLHIHVLINNEIQNGEIC